MNRAWKGIVVGGLILVGAGHSVGCASTAAEGETWSLEDEATASVAVDEEQGQASRLGQSDRINPVDGTPYEVYSFEVTERTSVIIRAQSGEMTPRLALYAPDGTLMSTTAQPAMGHGGYGGQAAGPVSLIQQVYEPGTYVVVVASEEARAYGSYELSVETLDNPEPLAVGESTEYFLYGQQNQHRSVDRPVTTHDLSIDEEAHVEIGLTSNQFDTYLYLVDAATDEVIAQNDDWGSGTDSQITVPLQPGDYKVLVGSYSQPASGSYTVRVEETTIERSENFELGETYHGFLSTDREPISGTARSGQPLAFELEEPEVIDAVLSSSDFDAYLVLTDDQGNVIAEDDDSGGGLNSRINWELEPGQYTLWASSLGEQGMGAYTVQTSVGGMVQVEQEPMTPTVSGEVVIEDTLQAGSSVEGRLTQEAPVIEETQTFVMYYELELEADSDLILELRSEEFDTVLLLEDESGEVIEYNDDGFPDSTNSQIPASLEAGTYRVGVSTYSPGEVGEFELSIEEDLDDDVQAI